MASCEDNAGENSRLKSTIARAKQKEMGTPAQALDILLGRTEEAYQSPRPSRGGLILYGAGNLGRSVLRRLRAAGVEPLAFADDTQSKQGTVLDGLEVLQPEQVISRFGPDALFAVTILNPALRFLDARRNLRRRTGCDAVSFLALGRMFPGALLPHLQYDTVSQMLQSRSAIQRAFDVFSDEESRRQFVAHVEFRLTANYEALPAKSHPAYFPRDLIAEFPGDCTFVDCGAYDGDSVRQFLLHQRGRFGTIHAFEPDRLNYERLRSYVRSLDADVSSKIKLHQGAVGDHSGEIKFNETGDMSAAVTTEATGTAALYALDDVVHPDRSATYIKLDIEGFEVQALKGARRLLETRRPTLAVSIYHRPDDLWEIPLYLRDLNLGYRLALRTEGEDGMDVVCYAVSTSSNVQPS